MTATPKYDLVVIGSGAAGLTAALAAAVEGAKVLVLERASRLGGTSAISGGQIWAPMNPLMARAGAADDAEAAFIYLERVTMGLVAQDRLRLYVQRSAELLDFLQRFTELRFFRVDRPDYHPAFDGARDGRAIEPLPYDPRSMGGFDTLVRTSPVRSPVTSLEGRSGIDATLLTDRIAKGIRTQGAALVAGLVQSCRTHQVAFAFGARALDLVVEDGRVAGCRYLRDDGQIQTQRAECGVVLASGGFEWSEALKRAFLAPADDAPTSPPFNEGDGLVMGLEAGAGLAHMTEAWWTAAVRVPGEEFDGHPFYRNIVRELALPGSIVVNSKGRRFVNEASSYHDLGKAFQRFDPEFYEYPNRSAWLIFDKTFKDRYPIVNVKPGDDAPAWFETAPVLSELARKIGIDWEMLSDTVRRFNAFADSGNDRDFGRGDDRHGRTYGDADHRPNPCLGPILVPPFFAIRILHGNNGTKGGLTNDADGRVLRFDRTVIAGLFACGNVAASPMGPGYPGTGGSLGPSMTEAIFAGRAAAAAFRKKEGVA